MDEEWKDVIGAEGILQVSSYGRVRSRRRGNGRMLPDGEWRICDLTPHSKGYPTVTVNGQRRLVHILVLEAFDRPAQPGEVSRHHPDPTRTNCHRDNLRWGTAEDNMRDAAMDGNISTQVLTADAVRTIRNELRDRPRTYQTLREVQQRWPQASVETIRSIRNGTTWGWLDDERTT